MLLYAAIIGYILSNIIGLALVFTGKKVNPGVFRLLASLHLLFGVFFIFNLITNKEESPHYVSFLIFFCSGIITGGLALGTKTNLVLKIYFGLFCLSIFIFILSPSLMLNFLLTASFSRHKDLIPVKENYFLERQASAYSSDSSGIKYKLIEKSGMFHKTIARDLDFKGKLDSMKILLYEQQRYFLVRGYSGTKNFVEDRIDSVDLKIDLSTARKDVIERRL
jgi:hypothetical protein